MLTSTENHGELIEQLRKARNITRDELCADIISKRNYQRFTKNEVNISSEKIMLLIDRLGLDYFMYRVTYKKANEANYSLLNSAFNKLVALDLKDAEILLTRIDKEALESKVNIQTYDYIELILNHSKANLSSDILISKLKELINYPEVLEKSVLNRVEINSLVTLVSRTYHEDKKEIIDYMVSVIENSSSFNINELSTNDYKTLLSAVVAGYYAIKEYNKCIHYADVAIINNTADHSIKGLTNLYGYRILSMHRLNQKNKIDEFLLPLYNLLMFENNEYRINSFNKVFKKELGYTITNIFKTEKKDEFS